MGAFYGSIQLRSDDRETVIAVLESLAKRRRKFLVSPAINGWIGVYPNDSGQDDSVSKAVAKKINDDLIHLIVHDDDVLCYFFYRGGKLVDKYNSCPDYFEPVSNQAKARWRARPERLADLLRDPGDRRRLEALLDPSRDEPVFESESLGELADLLGIRNALTAYEYLMAGETDSIEGWDEFVHIPDLSEERRQQAQRRARIAAQKQRLRDEGKLLVDSQAAESDAGVSFPIWCPDHLGTGFFVLWESTVRAGLSEVQRYAAPWGQPAPTGLSVGPNVHVMRASPSGRLFATGHAGRTWKAMLWDMTAKSLLFEVQHEWRVEWLGFTKDERTLISLSPNEILVTDVEHGAQTAAFEIVQGATAALHPSEKWLVAGGQRGLTIIDLNTGNLLRTLRISTPECDRLAKLLAAHAQEKVASWDPREFADRTEKAFKRDEASLGHESAAQVREQIEATYRSFVDGSAFSRTAQMSEHVRQLQFDPTGEFLFCAASEGVRVFACTDVVAASAEAPRPVFAVDSEPAGIETGTPGHTYALAHDEKGKRLLFGGIGGRIQFLDLTSGKAGTLIEIPGRPAVFKLGFYGDLSAICCTCLPGLGHIRAQQEPPLLQVWSHARLADDVAP